MKEKREQILEAVLGLFMEEGLKGMKVSAIARRADVGKGTVYEYFKSKEELFLGAVAYGIEQLSVMVNEKLEMTESFRDSFDSIVDCIAEIANRGPFMTFMTDTANMPFSNETVLKLKEILQSAFVNFSSAMSEVLKKGTEEGLIKYPEDQKYIRAMLVIISNMTMQHVHNGHEDLDELKDFYYEACLKLLA